MNFDMWFSKAIIGVSISAAVAAGIYYTKSAWCLWALLIIVMVYQYMSEKGNSHRKLFHCDYFGWWFYCDHARRGTKRTDKRRAIKAARKARKDSVRYIDKDC